MKNQKENWGREKELRHQRNTREGEKLGAKPRKEEEDVMELWNRTAQQKTRQKHRKNHLQPKAKYHRTKPFEADWGNISGKNHRHLLISSRRMQWHRARTLTDSSKGDPPGPRGGSSRERTTRERRGSLRGGPREGRLPGEGPACLSKGRRQEQQGQPPDAIEA